MLPCRLKSGICDTNQERVKDIVKDKVDIAIELAHYFTCFKGYGIEAYIAATRDYSSSI